MTKYVFQHDNARGLNGSGSDLLPKSDVYLSLQIWDSLMKEGRGIMKMEYLFVSRKQVGLQKYS